VGVKESFTLFRFDIQLVARLVKVWRSFSDFLCGKCKTWQHVVHATSKKGRICCQKYLPYDKKDSFLR